MAASKNNNSKSNTSKNKSTATKSGSTKKTNTGSKTRNTKNNQTPEEGASFGEEIVLLVFIAVCILLELSNFGLCGVIGELLSRIMFGLFGFVAYVLPVYLFLSAAFLISNQYKPRVVKKVVYAGLLCLVISVFIQMLLGVEVENLLSFYKDASIARTGGGLLGGVFASLLVKGLGQVGGYIVLFVLAMIFIVLFTEISFVDALKGQLGFMSVDSYEEKQEKRQKRAREREVKQQTKQVARAESKKNASEDDPFHRNQKSNVDMSEALRVLPADTDQGIIRPGEQGTALHPVIEEEIHEITMDFEPDDEIEYGAENMVPEEPKKRKTRRTKQSQAETREAVSEINHELSEAGGYAGTTQPEMSGNASSNTYTNMETQAGTATKARISSQTSSDAPASGKAGDTYQFPPLDLLKKGKGERSGSQEQSVRETAVKLQQTLKSFGVNVTITNYSCGPAVTRYEMQPEQGVKVSKIVGLADDIKLNLAAADIRIEAPIPGKAAVGIEVPNKENAVVNFRDLVESEKFKKFPSDMSFAVGKDIGGQVVVTDIAKMPHLLIAGATGSGKSVCINTLIMSILYKAHPDDVKMIMIDPKMVELSVYNGIPHLLVPVVTDPKKAAGALNWAVIEMTKRYQLFAEYGVRNLKGYNKKIEEVLATGDVDPEKMPEKMPQIVVIVDELADLMMVAHGEVEDAIVRLSQLARAAGIHLVIATQRPSVDVITGLIKANVPSRIAFAVSSGVDSRTILDMVGAEKLLGKGDMLFYPTGYPKPVRVQGAFVSDDEVAAVTDFIKAQKPESGYDAQVVSQMDSAVTAAQPGQGGSSPANDRDDYFVEAGRFIIEKDKASIGLLQRVYKIGFNRAARLMDQLADAGVVGPEEGTKPRKVLMSLEEFEQYIEEYV